MHKQHIIGGALIIFAIALLFTLAFVKADIDKQSTALCKFVAADPDMTMDECPAHQNNSSWLIVIAFGIAFLMFGSGIYLLLAPLDKATKRKKNVKLDEDEQKVCDLLKENDGSMYQSDLIKETGLSKVKITRIVDKLENKDVVERKRRGMTNLVVLK